jgi:hypothetical protein
VVTHPLEGGHELVEGRGLGLQRTGFVPRRSRTDAQGEPSATIRTVGNLQAAPLQPCVLWVFHTSTGTEQPCPHPAGYTALVDTPPGTHSVFTQTDGWEDGGLRPMYRPKYSTTTGWRSTATVPFRPTPFRPTPRPIAAYG